MYVRTPWLGGVCVMLALLCGGPAQAQHPSPVPPAPADHTGMERDAPMDHTAMAQHMQGGVEQLHGMLMMQYMQEMMQRMHRQQARREGDDEPRMQRQRRHKSQDRQGKDEDNEAEEDESDKAEESPRQRRRGAQRAGARFDVQETLRQMHDMLMLQQMQSLLQQMPGRSGMMGQGGMMGRRGMMGQGGMMGHGGMMGQGGMMGRGGMMGHGGIQGHLAMLAQQLDLSPEQQTQASNILQPHAKEMVRLRADITTLELDLPSLLEASPVDLAAVKLKVEGIAAKEAELRLSHIKAMQDVRQLLTAEQQQKFRRLSGPLGTPGHMPGHGGKP